MSQEKANVSQGGARVPDEEFFVTKAEAVIERIPQQPQRQDGTDDQVRDVLRAATRLGCYDAADWIKGAFNAAGDGPWRVER